MGFTPVTAGMNVVIKGYITDIIPDRRMAEITTIYGAKYEVPYDIVPGKVVPKVGECWLIDRVLGGWLLSRIVGQPPAAWTPEIEEASGSEADPDAELKWWLAL